MEQRDNQDSKDGQKRSTDQQGQSAASSGSYGEQRQL